MNLQGSCSPRLWPGATADCSGEKSDFLLFGSNISLFRAAWSLTPCGASPSADFIFLLLSLRPAARTGSFLCNVFMVRSFLPGRILSGRVFLCSLCGQNKKTVFSHFGRHCLYCGALLVSKKDGGYSDPPSMLSLLSYRLLYGSFFRCQLFCMEDVKRSEKIFSGFGNRRKNKKMAGVPNRGNPGVSHHYLPSP